jgi:hypothetical protein
MKTQYFDPSEQKWKDCSEEEARRFDKWGFHVQFSRDDGKTWREFNVYAVRFLMPEKVG